MSWWNRLRRKATASSPGDPIQLAGFKLPGWNESAPQQGMRAWHDSDGDVLTLTTIKKGIKYPFESDEADQRRWCRELARNRDGGIFAILALS